jgi:RNA polymerase sigma-70 factor (ECF subfamily)
MLLIPIVISSIQDDDDRDFFTQLYIKNHAVMHRVALRCAQSSFEADDIVSDALIALIRKAPLLRSMDPPALRAYVFTTVRNCGARYARKRKSAHELPLENIVEGPFDADGESDPLEAVLRQCTIDEIRRAVKKLNETDQVTLIMKYYLHWDDAGIAEELGLKPASVRSRLLRARQHLCDMLKEAGRE